MYIPQHLHIISNDEIKEDDYYILFTDKALTVLRCTGDGDYFDCKKIIATTDTSLNYETPFYGMDADNNFPQPSQQFITKYIEEYNKGNIITDVLVEYEEIYNDYGETDIFDLVCTNHSKISRIKINPKDNTITIKKLKDSWNREEVIENLITMHINLYGADKYQLDKVNQWIEENL